MAICIRIGSKALCQKTIDDLNSALDVCQQQMELENRQAKIVAMSPSAAIFKKKRRKIKSAISFYTKEAIAEWQQATDKHLFGSLGGASQPSRALKERGSDSKDAWADIFLAAVRR